MVARDCPAETHKASYSAPSTFPVLGPSLPAQGGRCLLGGTVRYRQSCVTSHPTLVCHHHPLSPGPSPIPQAAQPPCFFALPPEGHRKCTSAQSPREGAQALLRGRLQGQVLLQACKEAASILRPRFTGLYNGNIHTTLPGALCLLPREEGAPGLSPREWDYL